MAGQIQRVDGHAIHAPQLRRPHQVIFARTMHQHHRQPGVGRAGLGIKQFFVVDVDERHGVPPSPVHREANERGERRVRVTFQ